MYLTRKHEKIEREKFRKNQKGRQTQKAREEGKKDRGKEG